MDMMDMTGVVVIWSVGVFGFCLGLLASPLLWERLLKRHKTPEPVPPVPMPNGLHVLREVKDVVEPKPLARYERDIVQVFIDMDKRGTMW